MNKNIKIKLKNNIKERIYLSYGSLAADYYHLLTFSPSYVIMGRAIFLSQTTRRLYGCSSLEVAPQTTTKMSNSIDKSPNYDIIMMEECTLVCEQTTRGGYLYAGTPRLLCI